MNKADRRIYDLIQELGTASPVTLHRRLGLWYSFGKLYVQLTRLEDEGWISSQREEVTDPERLAARGGRPERVYFVARVPDADR